MTEQRVLVFTCEPGGAVMLIPVIALLKKSGFHVDVLSYGYGGQVFSKNSIPFAEIAGIADVDGVLLKRFRPHFVITSATSLPTADMSEKYLWQIAKENGVETIAFCDQWQNYALRFSGPAVSEKLAYLPDYINCINDIGRTEMIAEGLPERKLFTFGHPYLSIIKHIYNCLQIEEILPRVGISMAGYDDRETLLFVSEPIEEYYRDMRGYNQYSVIEHFLNNVRRTARHSRVIIKLHPKDDKARFAYLTLGRSNPSVNLVQNEISSIECLKLTNHVFGMTSLMLIESFILGKMVTSLQPGLIGVDQCVLSRHAFIQNITNHEPFDPFYFERDKATYFDILFNEEDFIDFLKRRLKLS